MSQIILDPTIAALVGTAIGALAGVGGTIAASLITKRSEERRHARELAFTSALEEWRASCEAAKRLADQGKRAATFGLDAYVLRMYLMNEFLRKGDFTVNNVAAHWAQMDEVIDRVCDDIKARHNQRQRPGAAS